MRVMLPALAAETLMQLPASSSVPHASALMLESVGGAVPLDSPFYIPRPTDQMFRDAIARRESLVLVKGGRQMGKTSLLARGLQYARSTGSKVILTDIQKLNATELATSHAFLFTLADMVADQLDLAVLPQERWDSTLSPNANFERYLQNEILAQMSTQLVWGLDELDRLFVADFSDEIFALFRSWHNQRALDPEGPWSHLTLAISYATEAHLFISDLNQSPFNLGTRMTLEDFNFEQTAELNRRYGSPLQTETECARYYKLVGGHPFLVRRGLHELVTKHLSLDDLEKQADCEDGIFGDHLRRIPLLLAEDPSFREIVRGVLLGKMCPTMASFDRLRRAGLVKGASHKDVQPRCQLYASFLKRHLK